MNQLERYRPGVEKLRGEIERIAHESAFAGVVRIDVEGETVLAEPFGDADRAHGIVNSLETQFAIASGSKGFTALAVARLVEDGIFQWSTTARSLLGADLPAVDDSVTVEHLLGHTSGIGDYLDEEQLGDISEYVLARPVHELATTDAFIPLLDGHPQVSAPGTAFAYNNGGYVLLAVLMERASGESYHDLIDRIVIKPAGLDHTAFLRSDALPGSAAVGYLHAAPSLRTNVLHLPVRGTGDGGCYTTLADVHRFWAALFAGAIVSRASLQEMMRPRHHVASERKRFGLGLWLHSASDAVILEGYDAGVSFRTTHDPMRQRTWTVISNWSEGAWPLIHWLDDAYSFEVRIATVR